MKIRILLLISSTFLLVSCKKEIIKPKFEYNKKANELIEYIIYQENLDCLLEMPKKSMIEIDTLESPTFQYVNFYIKRLSLKNKKELDSLNKLSENFVLDENILLKRNIKIINRDSLRILNKDVNFQTKICEDLKYILKPIFNKEFTIAIIEYGYTGMCLSNSKTIYVYKNKKWNKIKDEY